MSIQTKYDHANNDEQKFEGMMQYLSIGIFQSIFSFQKASNIKGDMIEFGVYKGKSA